MTVTLRYTPILTEDLFPPVEMDREMAERVDWQATAADEAAERIESIVREAIEADDDPEFAVDRVVDALVPYLTVRFVEAYCNDCDLQAWQGRDGLQCACSEPACHHLSQRRAV